jgi:hypothetical protein
MLPEHVAVLLQQTDDTDADRAETGNANAQSACGGVFSSHAIESVEGA